MVLTSSSSRELRIVFSSMEEKHCTISSTAFSLQSCAASHAQSVSQVQPRGRTTNMALCAAGVTAALTCRMS